MTEDQLLRNVYEAAKKALPVIERGSRVWWMATGGNPPPELDDLKKAVEAVTRK